MVDPDRKINRHNNSKDIEFLKEIEDEFGERFLRMDQEFVEYCNTGAPPPPIMDDDDYIKSFSTNAPTRGAGGSGWNHRGGGGRGRNNRYIPYDQRNRNRGYKSYDNNAGASGAYGQNSYNPHNSFGYRKGNDNDVREQSTRTSNNQNSRDDQQQSPYKKLKYPGGYSNFVPASKD